MRISGVRGWLRLTAAAATALSLFGCVAAQDTITSGGGLGEQLQTFASDALRHAFAAWLF